MKILSSKQIYQLDKETISKQNISSAELMERAGTKVFEWLVKKFNKEQSVFKIFCGVGNNGGDGLVISRLLHQANYKVDVFVVSFSNKKSEDFQINEERLRQLNVPLTKIEGVKDIPLLKKSDILIDAIFGIGLNRSPEGWVKDLIQNMNHSHAQIIAVDIPSGLFAQTPVKDAEAVVRAAHTLTFQVPKLSFILPETAPFVSHFECLNIGLDQEYIEKAEPLGEWVSIAHIKEIYRPRKKFGYKGTYGHVLIIGGSYGKIGAAVLSSKAAFRIGAGMVTTFIPKCGYQIVQTAIPEAMVITDKESDFITEITYEFKPSSIGVGIGMGKNPITLEALHQLFKKFDGPYVIDADALNLISENKALLEVLPKNAVLTPHPGELKRLIGEWNDDYDKLEKTKRFSKKHQVIIVIKGAYTITVDQDQLFVNTTGNPGMGTAGSGDVLTGIISGLRSQKYGAREAAILGVYLHGAAGDRAAAKMGEETIKAGDITDFLGPSFLDII